MKAYPDSIALRSPRSLDDLLLYRIWHAVRESNSMATRLVEGGFGITHREWGMIGVLAKTGEVTSSAFAEQLHLDRVSTSRGVRGLVEKGLVERRRDDNDGRGVYVSLSSAGQRLFEDLFPRIARLNVDLLKDIDAAHMDIFLRCLRLVERRGAELNAQGLISEKANRRSGGTRRRWPRWST